MESKQEPKSLLRPKILRLLQQNDNLCDQLYSCLSLVFKAYGNVLNDGENQEINEIELDKLSPGVSLSSDEMENALIIMKTCIKDFIMKVRKIKSNSTEILDRLKDYRFNLKPNNSFEHFLDNAVTNLQMYELGRIVQENLANKPY